MQYTEMTKAVTDAIKGELTAVNKWQTAGTSVREFFGTETAVTEVKAQFIADAIVPALDKKHQSALNKDLPRKGSADYVAFIGSHGADAWENANKAKKDAKSTAHTMFARVVSYAFPKEKTESTPKTLETKLTELINDAIGKCEKAEAPSFDVNETLKHLRNALALVNPKPL